MPDLLWNRIRPLLDADEGQKPMGRPPADRRRALNGIIYRLRTGCPWKHIPRTFGDDSTLNRYFRRWRVRGVFDQIWKLIGEECRELASIDWGRNLSSPALEEPAAAEGTMSLEDAGLALKRPMRARA